MDFLVAENIDAPTLLAILDEGLQQLEEEGISPRRVITIVLPEKLEHRLFEHIHKTQGDVFIAAAQLTERRQICQQQNLPFSRITFRGIPLLASKFRGRELLPELLISFM